VIVEVIIYGGIYGGGVFVEIFTFAPDIHIASTFQEGVDINSAHGGAEQSDCAKDCESSTYAIGDFEASQISIIGNLAKSSLAGIGGSDNLVFQAIVAKLIE
jgi:hypothetical protein